MDLEYEDSKDPESNRIRPLSSLRNRPVTAKIKNSNIVKSNKSNSVNKQSKLTGVNYNDFDVTTEENNKEKIEEIK